MYARKASEDQRPRIIILWTGSFARKSAIAAPDRREWEPISVCR
jgi:hypothetical protein